MEPWPCQYLQPYNDMVWRIIASMVLYQEISTLLFTNANQVAEHAFVIQRIMSDTNHGALLTSREQDSFKLDTPVKVPLGDLNPSYLGLVFPGTEPENGFYHPLGGQREDPSCG